jgi:hypothetical protein
LAGAIVSIGTTWWLVERRDEADQKEEGADIEQIE